MERFLPGRHVIESFGNGGFRLGGVSHLGAIIITPTGVRACSASAVEGILESHVAALEAERLDIDMILIGTGRDNKALPIDVANRLRNIGAAFDVMSTNAAVRIYNVVVAEDRRVAALLLAVEKAYG